MKSKTSKGAFVSATVLCLAAVSLISTPASASGDIGNDDPDHPDFMSHFKIQSSYIGEPEFSSIAGLKGLIDGEAGSLPPVEDALLLQCFGAGSEASYVYLNEERIAHSNSNFSAYLAANEEALTIDALGWSVFVEVDNEGYVLGPATATSGQGDHTILGYKAVRKSHGFVELDEYSCQIRNSAA